MTVDATGSGSARAQELLRSVEEQVAARREQLAALRRADGTQAEPDAPLAPSSPPPPGTYTPDIAPPRRLALAPEPVAATPPAEATADAGEESPGAAELRDLAGAIASTARRVEELAMRLERATHRITTPPPPAAPPPPPAPRSGPLAEALSTGPRASSAASELSARLVAIEMAVAGATRGEVALRLSREFFGEDAAPILDDVFGSGTAGATRMPWATND
jgi:hypothetical protein